MIIELTGIPCSGKSTLADRIASGFAGRDGFITSAQCCILEQYHCGLLGRSAAGTIIYDIILLGIFLKNYGKFKAVFGELLNSMRKNEKRLLARLNVTRNIIKKISVDHYFRNKHPDKTVFIDEGVSHILFNVFSGRQLVSENDLKTTAAKLPLPNMIVIIEAPAETIKERLACRGHKRFGKFSSGTIENNLAILEGIKNYYGDKTLVITADSSEPFETLPDKIRKMKAI